jgi:hypothetical protein
MSDSEPELVYVYIPESIGPMDRGDKYEDPIIEELERLGLGEVSGAGTELGDEGPDGRRPIVSCGIDVDTNDVAATRSALRDLLPGLGCPKGTQVQYEQAGKPLQDEYDGAEWVLEKEPASDAATGSGISISSSLKGES